MTTTIRVDENLKKQSERILKELGLTMSGAMTIFLKQVVREKGIPFDLKLNEPNSETKKVLDGILSGTEPVHGPFNSVDELMEDLIRA